MKKIKVALICHFSTVEVRELLPLDNRKMYTLARKFLRMPTKDSTYGDIAPWTSSLISQLNKRNDVDLYVISAQTGLKKMQFSFTLNKVHYFFVKADYTTLMKRLIKSDDLWRKLNPMRFVIRNIVKKISPDIVNLVGAENAYISGTVLDINTYPVYVLCQTIYNNPDRVKYGEVDSKNASTERLIFQKEKYYGVYSQMHFNLLREIKPDSFIFDFKWPSNKLPDVEMVNDKKYDFVNFAAAYSYQKGFHDSIKALAIVKRNYPHIKLNLVGGGDLEVKKELENLISDLNLESNIVFTPFFEKQDDLFQHLQNSRFAVLPCKMDNISGTMLQVMHYGLPLVVYRTPGTPTLNRFGESVLISEHSNIESLASNMLRLMDNPQLVERLRNNAKTYIEKTTNDFDIVERLVSNYRAIISHFHQNIPIPNDLFFNSDKQ